MKLATSIYTLVKTSVALVEDGEFKTGYNCQEIIRIELIFFIN